MLTENEIAAMKERDTNAYCRDFMFCSPLSQDEKDRHTLLLEREELLKDKERLDWVLNEPESVYRLYWAGLDKSVARTRKAIDATIAKEKQV